MKKILLAITLALVAIVSFAGHSAEADSTANLLSVAVLPTKDLAKVPVQVSLTNELPITCVQCYLATPDTVNIFLFESEDRKSAIYTASDRWEANHQAVIAWNTPHCPNTLMTMVVSTKSEDFKQNSGPIITVYFDASKLGDGDYAVRMTGGNAVWTDKKKVKVYNTPDAEAPFSIKRGKLKVK